MPTALETERREIVATVREFVEQDVVPVASELEHADEYPTELVAQMKELGLFGVDDPGGVRRPRARPRRPTR